MIQEGPARADTSWQQSVVVDVGLGASYRAIGPRTIQTATTGIHVGVERRDDLGVIDVHRRAMAN